MKTVSATLASTAFVLSLAAVPAAASTLLGTHGNWEAYSYSEKRGKVCYAASLPTRADGKRETYVTVTHRPADKAFNVVSVTAGYTYLPGSSVELDIDGKKFNLFVAADGAWAKDAETDKQLVEAMKAGARMQVTGFPSKGKPTTDQYSLSGFTAAVNAITRACPAR